MCFNAAWSTEVHLASYTCTPTTPLNQKHSSPKGFEECLWWLKWAGNWGRYLVTVLSVCASVNSVTRSKASVFSNTSGNRDYRKCNFSRCFPPSRPGTSTTVSHWIEALTLYTCAFECLYLCVCVAAQEQRCLRSCTCVRACVFVCMCVMFLLCCCVCVRHLLLLCAVICVLSLAP